MSVEKENNNDGPQAGGHPLISILATVAGDGSEGAHPEPETLLSYHEGALSEAESEEVQSHLAACRACAEALLDLADFAGSEDRGLATGVTDFETAAAWRAMKGTFAEKTPAEKAPVERRTAPTFLPYAVAAALLLTTVGFGLRTVEQQSRLAELTGPRLNVPIVYLDATTRADTDRVDVPTPPEGTQAMVFATPTKLGYPLYGVELSTADGTVLWTGEGLELSENETLRFTLPRELLGRELSSPGERVLRIFGLEGDRRVAAGEHRLSIRPAT